MPLLDEPLELEPDDLTVPLDVPELEEPELDEPDERTVPLDEPLELEPDDLTVPLDEPDLDEPELDEPDERTVPLLPVERVGDDDLTVPVDPVERVVPVVRPTVPVLRLCPALPVAERTAPGAAAEPVTPDPNPS